MRKTFTTTALAALLLVGACAPGGVTIGPEVTTAGPPATPVTTIGTVDPGTPPTTTIPIVDERAQLTIYFMADDGANKGRSGPFLIPVARSVPIDEYGLYGAVVALLDGTTDVESAASPAIVSSVPANSSLLGVKVVDGVAEINISAAFESGGGSFSITSRLAQLVFTATEFGTVDSVRLLIDGQPVDVFSSEGLVIEEPMTRDDFVDLVPNILVESPAWGGSAFGPLWLTGTAAVFEAVFQARLEAGGEVLWEGIVPTTNGAGWGEFGMLISYELEEATAGTLTVWEFSAEDGSVVNKRIHPITVEAWSTVAENGCPTIPGQGGTAAGEVQFTFVESIDRLEDGIQMVLDYASFMTGPMARAAAAADGQEAPNDYYIQNVNPQLRYLELAADAVVCLNDSDLTLRPATQDQYLAAFNDLDRSVWFGGGRMVWVTVDQDRVTSVTEQYVP